MDNSFRYVFNENLFNGFWMPMPQEDGRQVFRIFYPEHAEQFGEHFDIIETGNHHSPYEPKMTEEFGQFYKTVINWFADFRLLTS